MELGRVYSDAYRRGILLGLFFLVPAIVVYGFILFGNADQLGIQIGLVIGTVFTVLAIFQFIFRKDGLYLYEVGLELVHFKRKKVLMYEEISYFTITSSWNLAGIGSSFISFRKSPHIVICLKNGKMIKTFFEANQFAASELGNKVTYVKS
ncbi:hypothetical protein [Enterococcus caccae]|uniref:Uncharacterized protein n=1 Tax=Enterococcus caccae ATCC BAA-1240 TaxID=1158612 RepID=R3WG95_9ENTE|nr:hypothetical protein [Enterococcus caccae]EOL46457.1 hypothetical protein UC7_01424 [Enterococcus caccae ATCC BAA-1240]EOT60826.1 hypothetical protein I580_01726 [Enterococcus caccae ATCC BAA-1240]OJG26153.1 hypothetical protein RU98_GL000655 [Enterococcus caccae]